MGSDKLEKLNVRIREGSWIARLAAKKLGARNVAIVIGRTIHLHNTRKREFIQNERWLKHELCHIAQFKRYGFIGFIVRYLWESMMKGYYNNRYEVEARQAESS